VSANPMRLFGEWARPCARYSTIWAAH
jgi:hypothetical protein